MTDGLLWLFLHEHLSCNSIPLGLENFMLLGLETFTLVIGNVHHVVLTKFLSPNFYGFLPGVKCTVAELTC
jgi:hypothetical protein